MMQPALAQQALFVCKVGGHTYSGGVPPPECKQEEIRVLNPDGTLQRIIPAPLTAEQRKAREEAEREQARKDEEAMAQSRKDRALLETYRSASEIEAARQRSLAARQDLVDRAQRRIDQYAEERKRLDGEAEFYAKRELPARLKNALQANEDLAAQQEKAKADNLQEIKSLNQRYDNELKRYRYLEEISGRSAGPHAQDGASGPATETREAAAREH